MADTQRDLLDEDGENRALRTFLMQYGLPGLTVGAMRDHMKRSGWGEEYLPFFVSCSNRDTHLTKAGAQLWIRHLLGMEGASRPAEVDDEGLPPLPPPVGIVEYAGPGKHQALLGDAYTSEQFRQGQRDARDYQRKVGEKIIARRNETIADLRFNIGELMKVVAPSHTTNKEK